jgi:radical SAM enzyme (TIGR01210 family)
LLINDRWVLDRRGAKAHLDPERAYGAFVEDECDPSGALVPTAVVLITNKECPFRCVMCDLWTHTLDETVPSGAIARQIRHALATLPPARQIKLYNAGSFFDPAAIPESEYEGIAASLERFERVIVEAHPAFLAGAHQARCLRLQRAIGGRLEVAIGLETVHADVLARLNKRMTLDGFRRASEFLRRHDMALRTFVLLKPPFMPAEAAEEWACRSLTFADECEASASTVIPTRGGNGAMEALEEPFTAPRLDALERVIEFGLTSCRGRVFADLWNIERFFSCRCSPQRSARLACMNERQQVAPRVECSCDAFV